MEKQFKFLNFQDVIIFSPKKYSDNRGEFFENFNNRDLVKICGFKFNTLQENISVSKKNVLRGLHFQKGTNAQTKLINVIKGSILDVIVDIRPGSKNFSKWISYYLDDIKNESMLIPTGYAHGFLSLQEGTKISYKVDKSYDKLSECSIIWNDNKIAVDWKIKNPLLSEKDESALTFEKNHKMKNFDGFTY